MVFVPRENGGSCYRRIALELPRINKLSCSCLADEMNSLSHAKNAQIGLADGDRHGLGSNPSDGQLQRDGASRGSRGRNFGIHLNDSKDQRGRSSGE